MGYNIFKGYEMTIYDAIESARYYAHCHGTSRVVFSKQIRRWYWFARIDYDYCQLSYWNRCNAGDYTNVKILTICPDGTVVQ